MKKQRITKLKLNEISGVDNPAQVGATVNLMKRADPPANPADPGKETDMFKTREELLAAISKALTTTPTEAEATTIVKSAESLKATDLVPAVIVKAAKVPVGELEPDADDTPGAKKMKKDLEKAQAIIGLNAIQKAFYDELKTDADKDAFLAKDAAGRDTDIAKTKGDDPVVYTTMDGVDIHKSAGELVLSLAKRADTSDRNLAVEKAARLDQDLAKRADVDLAKFAGDINTRKALLKAVDGIADSAVRTEVMKSLKAADAAMGGAFAKRGGTGSNEPDVTVAGTETPEAAEAALDEMAKTLMKADTKLDYAAAYTKSLDSVEGRQLYKAMNAQ